MRAIPRLLSISPPDAAGAAGWVARAPELVSEGADGLLLRALVGDEAPIRGWLEALMSTGATVLVHARTPGGAALAAALGIGLHLPDGAWGAATLVDGLRGASCHDRPRLVWAAETCDYALLSPVFAPHSKAAAGAVLGLERFAAACAGVRLPVLALGGIDGSRVEECLRAGAHGVAGIGAFGDPRSVAAMAAALGDRAS